MIRATYDETRAEATPCLGGCGKLCTHGPRYCRECETLRRVGSLTAVKTSVDTAITGHGERA